jgi:hypothetical protein
MSHDKLEEMLNKTWMYNARVFKIVSYKIDETSATIATDHEWLTFKTIDLNKKLKEFLPVAEQNAALVISQRKAEVACITNDLLDEIKNIREGNFDKNKIKSLNETINTLLGIFKTEAYLTKINGGKQ